MAGTLPFYGGEVRAVTQIGTTIYVGGHLTNLCTVKSTSYTVRCPGALTTEAIAAGLAIGGDFAGVGGATHQGFALFPGTP
jgi:hypothetical protein